MNGVSGNFTISEAPIPANTILCENILFHCEGGTDAVVELWHGEVQGSTIIPSFLEDSVVIHQIPEPITVSLMGLGCPALLRRRR